MNELHPWNPGEKVQLHNTLCRGDLIHVIMAPDLTRAGTVAPDADGLLPYLVWEPAYKSGASHEPGMVEGTIQGTQPAYRVNVGYFVCPSAGKLYIAGGVGDASFNIDWICSRGPHGPIESTYPNTLTIYDVRGDVIPPFGARSLAVPKVQQVTFVNTAGFSYTETLSPGEEYPLGAIVLLQAVTPGSFFFGIGVL